MIPLQFMIAPLWLASFGGMLIILAVFPMLRDKVIRQSLRRRYFLPDASLANADAQSAMGPVQHRRDTIHHTLWLIGGLVMGIGLIVLEPFAHWHPFMRLLLICLVTYLGYRVPHMRAEQRLKHRKRDIERDLPAMIDLLIVMLDSGASFDEAISRFVNDLHDPDRPIKQELRRLAHELSVSPNRQLAFQKFLAAMSSHDMRLFCSVLIQSELYGTPISRGLRGLAHEIRERHYHDIEARGGALGPKLTIPMTVFFLPLIFIVVLAPTLIRAFHLP